MTEVRIGKRVLALAQGDITRFAADAIVNAANRALAGGGGVDGAIHLASGPSIMAELRATYSNGCATGGAVITGAGELPAKRIIHAVGPQWGGGSNGEADLLASAYRASLRLADERNVASIAFPAISLGIYGYPLEQGAAIAVRTVAEHLGGPTTIGARRSCSAPRTPTAHFWKRYAPSGRRRLAPPKSQPDGIRARTAARARERSRLTRLESRFDRIRDPKGPLASGRVQLARPETHR